MATTIKLKNSVTTTNTPTSLAQGEVAINITDKKVWVGNAATTPIQLLGAGASGTFGALTCTSLTNSGLTSGRVTYASTGGLLADSANLTFNGTTLTANTIGAFTLGGTISGGGNQINNIVIGASTPLAGAFTTLSASGVATFSAGTVSAPAITTTGDTNTGIFFPAADTIAFTEGGVEAMRIDSSGNVGVGTSSPATKLDVRGNALFGANGRILLTESGGDAIIGGAAGTNFTALTVNNTERMRIDSSGNVGINTTSPNQALDVNGAIVNGINNAYGAYTRISGGTLKPWFATSGNDTIFYNTNSSGVIKWINGADTAERMRLTDGGDLLVGTTSALNNAAKVQISGGSGSTITSETTGTGATDHVNFRNGNGKVGTITTNGSATSYNTSSDYRLKENIAPMTGALVKVAQLKPVTYKWKIDGSHGEGFIAHELAEVLPNAVSGEKDGKEMQGVDYGKITPLLTAALQEALAKIESLEARLAALESK